MPSADSPEDAVGCCEAAATAAKFGAAPPAGPVPTAGASGVDWDRAEPADGADGAEDAAAAAAAAAVERASGHTERLRERLSLVRNSGIEAHAAGTNSRSNKK